MKTRFTPLDYSGEEIIISVGNAFVQAAQALDMAVEIAVRLDDRDTLLNAAALWMKLGECIEMPGHEEEVKEDVPQLGFYVKEGLIDE